MNIKNYLKGVISVLNLFPKTVDKQVKLYTFEKDDAKALRNDSIMVSNDFNVSYSSVINRQSLSSSGSIFSFSSGYSSSRNDRKAKSSYEK